MRYFGMLLFFSIIIALPVLAGPKVQQEAEYGPFMEVSSTTDKARLGMLIESESLACWSAADLRILRNTVFARHGWIFKDHDLQEHFSAQWWYEPNPEFDPSKVELSKVDEENIHAIKRWEAQIKAPKPTGGDGANAAIAKQTDDLSRVAGTLEVLDAYLTDKMAVEDGTAPEGFELPPLDYYKENAVKDPLTQAVDLGAAEASTSKKD